MTMWCCKNGIRERLWKRLDGRKGNYGIIIPYHIVLVAAATACALLEAAKKTWQAWLDTGVDGDAFDLWSLTIIINLFPVSHTQAAIYTSSLSNTRGHLLGSQLQSIIARGMLNLLLLALAKLNHNRGDLFKWPPANEKLNCCWEDAGNVN